MAPFNLSVWEYFPVLFYLFILIILSPLFFFFSDFFFWNFHYSDVGPLSHTYPLVIFSSLFKKIFFLLFLLLLYFASVSTFFLGFYLVFDFCCHNFNF